MNALIVDECEELRTALLLLLLMKGYTVFVSEDGNTALNILRNTHENFELLLTDFKVPGMTGTELIEEVIKLKVQKIVVLSSSANDEQLLEPLMRNHSQIKFLHKMTTTEKLLNFIAS